MIPLVVLVQAEQFLLPFFEKQVSLPGLFLFEDRA
jgi:hypothetical protein